MRFQCRLLPKHRPLLQYVPPHRVSTTQSSLVSPFPFAGSQTANKEHAQAAADATAALVQEALSTKETAAAAAQLALAAHAQAQADADAQTSATFMSRATKGQERHDVWAMKQKAAQDLAQKEAAQIQANHLHYTSDMAAAKTARSVAANRNNLVQKYTATAKSEAALRDTDLQNAAQAAASATKLATAAQAAQAEADHSAAAAAKLTAEAATWTVKAQAAQAAVAQAQAAVARHSAAAMAATAAAMQHRAAATRAIAAATKHDERSRVLQVLHAL